MNGDTIYLNDSTNPREHREYPLFRNGERIIVFDVEGFWIVQKHQYYKGNINGYDTYQLHRQAHEVLRQSITDSWDVLVNWTTSPDSLIKLVAYDSSFNQIDLSLGGHELREGEITKPLTFLTHDLGNIVAIEDNEFFIPEDRVIRVDEHTDLMGAYAKARGKVFLKR